MFHIHMHWLSCQIRCQNNGNKDAQDQVFIVPGLEYFAVMASHCQEKPQGVLCEYSLYLASLCIVVYDRTVLSRKKVRNGIEH